MAESASSEKHREKIEANIAKKIQDSIAESDVKSEFYLEMEVVLQTSEAKRLYRRIFDHIQTHATAAILVTRKHRLIDLSNKNSEMINEAFQQLLDELQTDTAWADAMMVDIGLKTMVTTDDAKKVSAKVRCPQGRVVLDMIRQLDSLAIKLKSLWVSGEITEAKSEDRIHGWQSKIFKISDAVRALGQQAYIEVEKRKQLDIQRADKAKAKQKSKRAASKEKTIAESV